MPPSSSRDGKLTLNVKNITVKELLQTIEKQSRYTFVYNISDLDPARRVSLSVTDASVEAVIAQAIPEVTATVRGTQVVLVRKAADKARPNVKITGTVRDADGVPLVGATLIVEGTTLGMSTGANGEYTLNVPANGKIVCSYLGYDSVTETVNARTRIDFQLRAAANSIEDVVVTALGITRKEKSLGYAVSKIGSDDITNNASGSWLSGMAGKVAGLNLDQSAAGPGGSVRVTLRGEGSLSYNNNTALFVVDGVPIGSGMDSNTSSGSYESDDAPIDYGNGAGDINPDDVESISVLKGPAATALYGSRAANGAIIVTTKSGRKQKGIGVTFTTSVTFDKAGYWPDFQNVYGAGDFRKTTINTGHMTNRKSRGRCVTCMPRSIRRRGPIRGFRTKYATGTRDSSGRALPTPTVWRWTPATAMARRCACRSRIRATTGSCPIRVSAPRTSRFRLSASGTNTSRPD